MLQLVKCTRIRHLKHTRMHIHYMKFLFISKYRKSNKYNLSALVSCTLHCVANYSRTTTIYLHVSITLFPTIENVM